MKKAILFMMALILGINASDAQTLFGWDTAYYDGEWGVVDGDIVETKNGITVRVRDNEPYLGGHDIRSHWGSQSTDEVIYFGGDEVTFDFDQPVNMNSILVYDTSSNQPRTWDCIFIPTGGSNTSVIIRLNHFANVNFDWVDVTSFKVIGANFDSASGLAAFVFDNLLVNTPLSTDDNKLQKTGVYPNPVEHTLHLKNSTELESIKLYNSLGLLVLESNKKEIDVSHLSKGMYVLKITSDYGMETRKIIKQ